MRTEKQISELLKRDSSIPEDSAICLRGLTFGYEENQTVLNSIDLDIKKGQYVSIIGHNGCGKSTLAKLIDGILVQNSGDIAIFGVVMTDSNALLLRKDIGLVFQNPDSQFIGATVRDDIAFGLENNQVDPKAMNDIIETRAKDVGMEDYLDSEPSNLSGGQKQRVAIAGMIARNPKIAILDEAGAMLDPKGKREIREIIAKRKMEDPEMTILNITHEIDEAYDSDRVLVMNEGKIILDDKPEVVFSNDVLLKSISLDIPFSHKLVRDLKAQGLDVGAVKNEEELLDKLCR
jgi:energy-coupling factor transport system ATP-binding protein